MSSKLWSSWKFNVCIAHTKINLESATGTTHSLHPFREMCENSLVLSFGPDLLHGMPLGTGPASFTEIDNGYKEAGILDRQTYSIEALIYINKFRGLHLSIWGSFGIDCVAELI
ncbi:hypothetical protein H112_08287 [Trichophyton rubrum D6]|uniref:Uncharacterized protein n=2 Tax=Trichophyton TaxID=5550 RepID=A0A022VNQ7_TRIRU|nr:hypothetical protein H100_08310 [Trichophyton rubrum MR850]EZF37318.1 hypothetical protein H102_08269 [Trichophyton rubrum CBS 100081]EZF47942.1 hypothetical protein H103_08292 [Trichophyton rubrum CBS 288.86]EZF58565.1 hypothetical protein H104_08243 [Trichophyton rubrum CBS 289.86]EZF69143.1 hypothetical protein H105_08297 [Trichophyton soudanense CBS 452.61]EZF79945.1 hypothetical protein H110_08291 [Trichophyton rubrum MR1448]EZF90586.1 hypothetical protein H113_08361 [Trichophyton rub